MQKKVVDQLHKVANAVVSMPKGSSTLLQRAVAAVKASLEIIKSVDVIWNNGRQSSVSDIVKKVQAVIKANVSLVIFI